MIQPGKWFVKFDCWSNKAFKNYKELNDVIVFHTNQFEKHHEKFHDQNTRCIRFSDLFRMGTFIDSTHMNLQSPSK